MTNVQKQSGDTDQLHPLVWKIAVIAMLGAFLSQIDATIINVSLATLARDMSTSVATIQWVTSGYLLALTLVLPLNSWIVDRIGAKRLYLWCFMAFGISSALCALAWSASSLIGFRVLQGMCGGLLAPMAQMMIARAAGKHMARVMGHSVIPVLFAPILGPILAGFILEYASWRWLFLVNVPVVALAFVLALIFLPDDRDQTNPRDMDWVGLALLPPALVLFLYGSDRIASPAGLIWLTAAIVLLALFIRTARGKGDRALINIKLFGRPIFRAAAVTQFLSNGVAFAGQMLIPLFLIEACGRSPGEMGWLLTPLGIGMMCTYPWLGALTKRFGIRQVSAGGAFLATCATSSFLYLATHPLNVVVLTIALFVRGVGQSAIGIPSISAAYTSVDRQQLAMATTTLNLSQRLGGPTFTTLCAIFLEWRLGASGGGSGVLAAFAMAFLLLSALHACVFAAALRLPVR